MKVDNRKYLLAILLSLIVWLPLLSAPVSFQNEALHYVISYKWGLIHKDAGDAVLSLKKAGDKYNIMLTARTKPWADKIYSVRDTLKGVLRASGLNPVSYTKITHEKDKYARDEITYSRNSSSTTGHCKRIRIKNGEPVIAEKALTASGPVYDMLSIFYYLRQLDYDQLNKNKIYTATIFSGDKKETIKIKSLGIEKIKLRDKSEKEAYHIKFNFTREGGKKSSDDIDTWISTDQSHIPLYLVGRLPVGEVRAYFTVEKSK